MHHGNWNNFGGAWLGWQPEQSLTRLWQAFLDGGGNAARESLILAYQPFVNYFVRWLGNHRQWAFENRLEDFEHAAMLAMIEAIDEYSAPGVRCYCEFRQRAWQRMFQACGKASKTDGYCIKDRNGGLVKFVCVHETVPGTDDLKWGDTIPDTRESSPDEIAHANSVGAMVRKAVLSLPPKLRRIVILRFWVGWNVSRIGRLLAVSKQRMHYILRTALTAIRWAIPLAERRAYS